MGGEYGLRGRRRIDCGSGSRPGRSGETGERLGRARVKSLTIPVTFLSIGKSKRCLDSARHDSETLAPQSVLLELELCGEAKTISIARGAADSPCADPASLFDRRMLIRKSNGQWTEAVVQFRTCGNLLRPFC